MNEINIKNYGVIQYENKDIIKFKNGLPGFEDLNQYVLVIPENSDFYILQSAQDENIGFVLISPFDVIQEYEFEIDDNTQYELEIKDILDVLILNTVTLSNEKNKITTNLRAPLIINMKNKKGEQIVLNNENYSIKHPLFKEGE